MLASRIRSILNASAEPRSIREVRMFGGLSFMVDEAMAVAAGRAGSLLVRVDPARRAELLQRGGEPAWMGTNRPMGAGWLNVPAARIVDDAELARWIELGIGARHSRT